MNTIIGKFYVAILAALILLPFDTIRAEENLSPEQMDRVTAGIRITDLANNGLFQASAIAKGTDASVDTEVGNNFGRASGKSTSYGTDPASSRAEAHKLPGIRAPAPQSQILPNSQLRFQPRPFIPFPR